MEQAEKEIKDYKNFFNKYVNSEIAKIQLEQSLLEKGQSMTQLVDSGLFLHENMQTANKILLNDTSVYFVKNTNERWNRLETDLKKKLNHF